ncbi:MAG TPA: class I SAM-dependent methyltransferase [Phycisphaerae bacterium]|nr:class I SAM-dependent methyltransferase [Phycisphaerae bacterium]
MSAHEDIFESAGWYDRGINWDARLGREVPVLAEVFGPPGAGGLLDAGCGSGRHVVALAKQGYAPVGLDASARMLELARDHAADAGVTARFVEATYAEAARAGNGFDGAYCLGNALAATGTHEEAQRSLAALASVLRPGGRLFVQILNFAKLRAERPAVRGPRVRREDDREYVSARTYAFTGREVQVVNVTFWQEGGVWRQHAHGGTLCAIEQGEIEAWCTAAGLAVEAEWGGYDRAGFDPGSSNDLIVVARRR